MNDKIDTIQNNLKSLKQDLSLCDLSDDDIQSIELKLKSVDSLVADIRSILKPVKAEKKKAQKKKDLASDIAHRMTTWTENCGEVTGAEWKEFCRDFKKMIKQE